jgi:hypothetical protein
MKFKTGNYIYYGQIGVFGFVLHTIFGAFYQVVPNSQQRKLPLEWISYIVFLSSVLASVYLYTKNLEIGYFFTISSIILFSIHIFSVVKNLSSLTVRYLFVSLIFLFFSGLFLFLSLKTQGFSVQVAIHTFTLGAMVNAILGVQTAWIPMIYMQPLGKTKVGKFIINNLFYFHQFVVLGIIFSFIINDYKFLAGFALFEFALILLFLKFMFYDSIKPQIKMIGIPYTVKFFIAGHIFLLTGLILAHIIGVSGIFTLIPYHIDFMVYGFGVFTILGGMLHLTPRIIFNMRQKAGKVLSRQKFENLFKVVCISYLIFVFLELFGISAGVFIYVISLILIFIVSVIDFYKLYRG